jgi:3-hydroxybutyryl-CoA dehydrogenase
MAQHVAVVGAGFMGAGIAQEAAVAGWNVVLHDLGSDAVERGVDAISASTATFVQKGRLTQELRDTALTRITTTTDLAAVADVDIVVEAVYEDADVKRQVFAELDRICSDHTILATNTSAIPITTIAAATARPEAVVGTHFFSPVPLMALCELVRGRRTSDQTLATARSFAESIGKTCIVVTRDVAGFVTTRLISALVMEAVKLYEAGVASAQDIDTACKLGFGHTMGPLATADLIGVDIMHHAAMNVYNETADPSFYPPELLSRMVDAGDLGRKSGKGFYVYSR